MPRLDGEKDRERICNKGPRRNDTETQGDACLYFAIVQSHLTSATLDELMPTFKAFVTDFRTSEWLINALNRTGHTDYALAVIEYAPNCDARCRGQFHVDRTPDGFHLNLLWGENSIVVSNPTDVMQILERSCHYDGDQYGCGWYAQAGGSYNEADRSQAQQSRTNDFEKASQASRDQGENRAPGFMSNLSDALTQVQQQQGATIQNANAQQQANLQAIAEAKQRQQQEQQQRQQQQEAQQNEQQRQQQEQARLTAEQNARTAQATAAQSCTDMTGNVRGTATIGSDGWVSGSLTNSSNSSVHVFYTFKVNGAPSNDMANAGSTTINPGQTVGGEGHGIYSTTADKNPGRIYWFAVLKSDHDQGKSCGNSHTW